MMSPSPVAPHAPAPAAAYAPAPTIAASPTRPGTLPQLPFVDVPAAMRPERSSASMAMVSCACGDAHATPHRRVGRASTPSAAAASPPPPPPTSAPNSPLARAFEGRRRHQIDLCQEHMHLASIMHFWPLSLSIGLERYRVHQAIHTALHPQYDIAGVQQHVAFWDDHRGACPRPPDCATACGKNAPI